MERNLEKLFRSQKKKLCLINVENKNYNSNDDEDLAKLSKTRPVGETKEESDLFSGSE